MSANWWGYSSLALVELLLLPLVGPLSGTCVGEPGAAGGADAHGNAGFRVGRHPLRGDASASAHARRPAPHPVVSDYRSGHDRWVRGTAALFQATLEHGVAQFWLALLVFFDAVFVTLALWTFEPLMTD